MSSPHRIRLSLVALAFIIIIGTAGFIIIDGANVFDAFYMVVITITTVVFARICASSVVPPNRSPNRSSG